MLKRFYILLFLLLGVVTAEAQLPLDQKRYADSLEQILHSNASDSVKSRTCFMLIYYWEPRDTAKAKGYLERGRKLGEKYPFLRAAAYAHEGQMYYNIDEARSEAAYRKADSLFSTFNTKEAFIARTNIWNNIAVIRQRNDDEPGSIDIVLNKAIPLSLRAQDTALTGSMYVGVGISFMNMEQYDKAELYFRNAVSTLNAAHTQPSRIIAAYNRMGENYLLLGKPEAARRVLDTLKGLLKPYPESELNAGYYQVEGMYYHAIKRYNLAVESFDKGIAAAGGTNKAYRIQELQLEKLKSLGAARKYKESYVLLQQLLADDLVMEMDDTRLGIYEAMAETLAGLGNSGEAYAWLRKYSMLNDSLHDNRLKNNINELEIRYKAVENEARIGKLSLEKQQAILHAKNTQLTNWLLAVACTCLLCACFFFIYYFRSSKKLSEQKELNYRQQLKEMEQKQLLASTEAMLEGEERERRRVARDLHDGLGGMLAGIKMRLSGHLQQELTLPGNGLDKIINQLDESVTELRRIARNMMPESLVRFGLQTALKDLCESVMSDTVAISFEAYNINGQLELSEQVIIYRIIQEALTNAIRHSGAANILLQCSQNENMFFITVEDDGKGFDVSALQHQKGIGLSNIESRVQYLKGKIDITSVPDEGTTINIELNVAS